MANATLDGARLKISRAEHHLLDLCAAINAFHNPKEDTDFITVYPDFERKRFDFEMGEIRQPDPAWCAVIGDIVHNLRSALDHLVCQLAVLNGNDIDCCKSSRTSFPICLTPESFSNASRRISPLINPDALALIEELQPYAAANKPTANPLQREPRFSNLWILSELDIIDKHRTLIIAARYHGPMEFTYTIDNGAPVTIPINAKWRPLENGAQIANIDISALALDRQHEMHVQMQAEMKILFYDTGCCDGLQIEDALGACFRHVSAIIDEFDGRFFGK
jgi:hypothetical protein